MPIVHIYAVNSTAPKDKALYPCPVYKKPRRTDLTYISSLWLKTAQAPSKWVLRGVALLCDIKWSNQAFLFLYVSSSSSRFHDFILLLITFPLIADCEIFQIPHGNISLWTHSKNKIEFRTKTNAFYCTSAKLFFKLNVQFYIRVRKFL